jgi:FxsC-like protein
MRERASFLQRLADAVPAPPEPTRHIVPVLWIPLPAWDRIPERAAALDIGHGVPAYAENGLRALCMLASYRKQYRIILRRLAQRIVEVAQTTPLPPAPTLTITELAETPPTETAATPFVVGVLAPTRASLPPHRTASGYGVTPRSWRPYAQAQQLPIAEYAANVAERLGLPTRIVDTSEDLGYLDNCPGVLLIDPWVAAGQDGAGALSVISGHLHQWVTPLLVADEDDPQYAESGAALDGQVTDRLHEIGAHRVRQSLKAEQFVQLMPSLVSEARRQYLKHAPVFLPKGPQRNRPRITGDGTSMPFTRKSSDD